MQREATQQGLALHGPEDSPAAALARVDEASLGAEQVLLHVSSGAPAPRHAGGEHVFSVRITSPLDNVFRLRVTHHRGRRERPPRLSVEAAPRELSSSAQDGGWSLRSGSLVLWIEREPWRLRFSEARGDLLTESPPGGLAMVGGRGAGKAIEEQLTLGVGELVYGLGERFQAFTRNGQSIEMWNSPDAGSATGGANKSVPFLLSSKGYGVFVNTPGRVRFEVGTCPVTRTRFAVPGEELDYFFIFGPNPKQVLNRLGAISGRPALPPAWSFGLWLGACMGTERGDQRLLSLLDGMSSHKLPVHGVSLDAGWMKAGRQCDFEWDAERVADPRALLSRLEAQGVRTSVWINPCIAERSRLFDEANRLGYLLYRQNGDVWQGAGWQPGKAYVDFTNPEATRWYQGKLRDLLRQGVAALEVDGGDCPPLDVAWFDGSDPELLHNHYPQLYQHAVFEVLEQERGGGEACIFAHAAAPTCQRFPVHHVRDLDGSFASMAASLRAGLSLGLCGFGFWSHELGAAQPLAPAVYKRWLAFGLLSSHTRLSGGPARPAPWAVDEEACDVLRQFAALKCRLMPYLMAAAVQAHTTSQPVLRAMALEFPDDPECRALDRQYLLGDGLLVAPVLHETRAEYYLPAGNWTHLLTGESRSGGRWQTEDLDFFGMPVWVRSGALICVGPSGAAVDYDFGRGVRLLCGRLEGRASLEARLFDGKGDPAGVLEVYHDGRRVRVKSPTLPDFQVHLPWAPSALEVERGSLVKDDPRAPLTSRGVIVRADSGTASFRYDGET